MGTWTRRWRFYRLRVFFYLTLLLLVWLAQGELATVARAHLIFVAAVIMLALMGINSVLFWFIRVRLPESSRTRMTRHVIVGCGVLALCAWSWPGPRTLDLLYRGVVILAELWLWAYESNLRYRLDPTHSRESR